MADDFADHYQNKIYDIRDTTSNAPAAVIEHRSVQSFLAFRPVNANEITRIIMK